MIEIVIGDVHARPDLLRALLDGLGVLNGSGRRRRGFWIVQVGDLLDRRASPECNQRTARLAIETLDVVLAGNHEVDLLNGKGCAHGAALATLALRGWPYAAAEAGGWLITHAGVHPGLSHGLARQAKDCAAEINDRWHRRTPGGLSDPLFDWVGPARRGVSPYGGLFWGDAGEWPPDGSTPWGQICGHVPQARPRLLPGPRWLIDLGTDQPRLAGLVRRKTGGWRPVIARLPGAGEAVRRTPGKRGRDLAA